MRKTVVKGLAAGTAGVLASVFLATSSGAASTSVDLSITGFTVAGFASAERFERLPVVFTIKNNSTTTSASVAFNFRETNSRTDATSFVCPLVSTRFDIATDGTSCEPGVLAPGKSTSSAIAVLPKISVGTVTVTACAQSQGPRDPRPSNNCKTVSIPIR